MDVYFCQVTAVNAHVKPIDIVSLWDILRIDISEQNSYFSSLCILVDYCYRMDTGGDTHTCIHAYRFGSAQHNHAVGRHTQLRMSSDQYTMEITQLV